MALEDITKIREVEDAMERVKADARVRGQKLTADAQREGRALLKREEEASAQAAADALRNAEKAAAKRREEILAQADRECEAIRIAAHARMDRAAQAILERGMGS